MELAAALGLSTDAGVRYLGCALEVRYRLPRLWARLADGELTVWRAFRIAEQTRALCPEAAATVDVRLAPFAHTVGAAQIDRTVTDALAAHDPSAAADRYAESADARCFQIHLVGARRSDRQGIRAASGVVEVAGLLDVRDALDLDLAVRDVAGQLVALGSTDTLDVRRSAALGEIARAQQTLDLTRVGDEAGDATRGPHGGGVTIYAHLRPGTPLAELDTPGIAGTHCWAGQVRAWCRTAGTKVTVVPVVDLAADLSTRSYTPTPAIRQVVELRDGRCVFPYCTRRARTSDKDHVTEWDLGGPTSTLNLAPLCRRHHRAKTHSAWTYETVSEPDGGVVPGHYRWTSPGGLTFAVTPTGTLPTCHRDDPPEQLHPPDG